MTMFISQDRGILPACAINLDRATARAFGKREKWAHLQFRISEKRMLGLALARVICHPEKY